MLEPGRSNPHWHTALAVFDSVEATGTGSGTKKLEALEPDHIRERDNLLNDISRSEDAYEVSKQKKDQGTRDSGIVKTHLTKWLTLYDLDQKVLKKIDSTPVLGSSLEWRMTYWEQTKEFCRRDKRKLEGELQWWKDNDSVQYQHLVNCGIVEELDAIVTRVKLVLRELRLGPYGGINYDND
ncbi:hypothetical protein LTS08_001517 [Lithohypha guttulata]|uniref:uncharacterized protein n=1 Tax=Lithohypha guttulata TaxID=1690604 RepID=UPI002DE0994C|nr:hypothetical protein LTR51_003817 [Lithohypha guttulata]KAK5105242.1 hypothetical protein LTS08_001517 [Lithohypha guttulata]